MIVGTAGHIDHGKTALVRALTGVDADRLPEEKARGITLELGFAYGDVGGVARMGFVDVPGHERLVRTMLAGATGVDCLMLVVAADDGLMPQTIEHLAIADLLGLEDALVVISKADRVDDDRIAEVSMEIEAALAGTSLEGSEIVAASAHTGRGVAEVAAKLARLGHGSATRSASGRFRLAIDRVFTLSGVGLVVTGTTHSGEVRVGDHVTLSPGGLTARIRGLRVNDTEAGIGQAGQRCALNVTGPRIEKASVDRGMWATAAGAGFETDRIDVRLRVSAAEAKALKHWTPVHVHLGSIDVSGRVSLLEKEPIAPGDSGFARLRLDQPTLAVARDRVVIRDQSATRTIGGGCVVDPDPPLRNARRPKRLAELAAMDRDKPAAALAGLLDLSPHGLDLGRFSRAWNLTSVEEDALWLESGLIQASGGPVALGFALAHWRALRETVVAALGAYQDQHSDSPGATVAETLRAAALPLARPAAAAALDSLVADGEIERFGSLVHLRGHEAQLTIEDENLWADIHAALAAAGLDQPRIAVLSELVAAQEEELRPTLTRLARLGRLRWINKNYFLLPETAAELAKRAEAVAGRHPEGLLTVGQFREDTQIHRHLTMPVLEFFDRVGFTARLNDGRRIQRPADAMFGHSA